LRLVRMRQNVCGLHKQTGIQNTRPGNHCHYAGTKDDALRFYLLLHFNTGIPTTTHCQPACLRQHDFCMHFVPLPTEPCDLICSHQSCNSVVARSIGAVVATSNLTLSAICMRDQSIAQMLAQSAATYIFTWRNSSLNTDGPLSHTIQDVSPRPSTPRAFVSRYRTKRRIYTQQASFTVGRRRSPVSPRSFCIALQLQHTISRVRRTYARQRWNDSMASQRFYGHRMWTLRKISLH
jgi:hypothetical protein